MDCTATPLQDIRTHDSNPATIKISHGGVARNIAANLASYGQQVRFLSVLSNDGFGKAMHDDLVELNIDTSKCLFRDAPSSMYLAMLDHHQDLLMAMVDTSLLEHIQPSHIVDFLKESGPDDIIVFDTNMNETIIATIVNNSQGTLVCDPISITKAKKIVPHLNKIDIFKPNRLQASALSGIDIVDDRSLIEAGMFFIDQGIQDVIITLGDQGGVWIDADSIWRYESSLNKVINTVGAGDAFLAAFIAFKHQYDKMETLKISIAAANKTCMCEDSVCKEITLKDLLHDDMTTIKIKELQR